MMSFGWPLMFLLLPLPLLLRKLLRAVPESGSGRLRIPDPDLFSSARSAGQSSSPSRRWLTTALVIWALLVLSAARPLWIGEPQQLPQSGRDLLIAVDLSPSMEMEDFLLGNRPVDRLTATKAILREFLRGRRTDRVGLILFGALPYVQAPLTFDLATVETLLLESEIGLAGDQTALGDAIGLAVKRLVSQQSNHRVLILFTDGSNTGGELDPEQAATIAAQQGIKIYTVGVGAEQSELPGLFGLRFAGPGSDLDEKTLRMIAQTTSGEYFRAQNTEELARISELLDELEPVQSDAQTIRPQKELFYLPLALALLLTGGLSILSLVSRRRS